MSPWVKKQSVRVLILALVLTGMVGSNKAASGGSSYEVEEAVVKKVYSANSEGHRFIAYVVEWKGAEVIVSDTLAHSDFNVGDTISVLAMKGRRSGPSGGYTNMSFALSGRSRTPGNATQTREQTRTMRLVQGDLSVAKNERERMVALGPAATKALKDGKTDLATKLAHELEGLVEKHKHEWSYGDARHAANQVLGRIALAKGRFEEAEQRLLVSVDSEGSPVLNSFGPSMVLAKELLAKGGKGVVLQYFERCRKFWKMGGERLDERTADVKAGRHPKFGASLR